MLDIHEFLVENSTWKGGTSRLKKILTNLGLLEEVCDACGCGNEWNGKFLSLQLEHSNGVRSDNRLSNLRILCPNCHSQTDTYCGKKNKKPVLKRCTICSKDLRDTNISGRCMKHKYTMEGSALGANWS